jgi:hypothetical protein
MTSRMAEVRLNWATAKVKDAKLTVGLEGKISPDWKDSFETTVRLLAGRDWGEVRVKKQTVRVSDVNAGSEEKLRHHLTSVVEQANATLRSDEPESKPSDSDAEQSDHDSPDARMTERFRGFAEDPET